MWPNIFAHVATVLLFILLFLLVFSGSKQLRIRLVVPGKHEIELISPGRYTIFYEYQSSIGGKAYSTGQDAPNLQYTLRSKETGDEIELFLKEGILKPKYFRVKRAGVGLFGFKIEEAGMYEFSASYPEEQKGPNIVLVFRRSFSVKGVAKVFVWLAVFFGLAAIIRLCSKRKRVPRQFEKDMELKHSIKQYGPPRADFWGVTRFSWVKGNREKTALFIVVFFSVWGLISFVTGRGNPILLLILGGGLAALFYIINLLVGLGIEKIRKRLPANALIQSDCLIVHGILQAPGIVYISDDHLILTLLVGNQITIPLSQISAITEYRWYNGLPYFGRTRFFKLSVSGKWRLGFGVANAEQWKAILFD